MKGPLCLEIVANDCDFAAYEKQLFRGGRVNIRAAIYWNMIGTYIAKPVFANTKGIKCQQEQDNSRIR